MEKRAPLYLFYCLCLDICEKKSQILVRLACGDHIVFKSKLPINYAQNSNKVECRVALLWLALDHICIVTGKNMKNLCHKIEIMGKIPKKI